MLRFRTLCSFLAVTLASAAVSSAAVQVYLSKPQTQSVDPSAAGALTADFDSATTGAFTTLSTPIGSYSNVPSNSTFGTIKANDKYGGFGLNNYLAVAPGGLVSASLATPASYFGMFFTAADNSDTITLYDAASTVLGTFSTQRLTTFLSSTTVVATDGTTVYNTAAFKGQPTAGGTGTPTQNPTEYYAYLNFIVTSGPKISRVEFSKSSGGAFESDNHSVGNTAPTVANSSTFVDLGPVPEPATVSLMALGALGMGWAIRRGRGRTA